jgi:hypothetical protein
MTHRVMLLLLAAHMLQEFDIFLFNYMKKQTSLYDSMIMLTQGGLSFIASLSGALNFH